MENNFNNNDTEVINLNGLDGEEREAESKDPETHSSENSHHSEHHHHHHHSSHHGSHSSSHHRSHSSSHHSGRHHSSRHHSSSRNKKKKIKVNKNLIWGFIIFILAFLLAFVIAFEVADLLEPNDRTQTSIENEIYEPIVNVVTTIKPTSIYKWDVPIYDASIPVFELSEEKPAMTNAPQTPESLYAMYDELMERHPQYITKIDLGLSSDGVTHVYRYDFREPDSRHTEGFQWSETKAKAIIVSGIHYEWSGIYGLYFALEEIADNPELYHLRRNSHLIVIPCANPFAASVSNYKKSEGVKNANGVEIHRNFEVDWKVTEETDKHYGGTAPLTEVETQYINNIMKENTDAAFFLTCHSFADESFNFIWPSVATPYMCNMGYRLIDKMSSAWMIRYGQELVGLEDYRTSNIEKWDNRLGYAHMSRTNGTETKQATKYGIQAANVEICGRFWTHGTKENTEPSMSSFTMSRGAEVYINFLLTAFGVYDPSDKLLYSAGLVEP